MSGIAALKRALCVHSDVEYIATTSTLYMSVSTILDLHAVADPVPGCVDTTLDVHLVDTA